MESGNVGVLIKTKRMATIDTSNGNTGRPGVRRMKRNPIRIDMTPMVDLGFLLITFFVMTARLSEPASLPLYMPKDGPPTDIPLSAAMTVLVDGKHVFYYAGEWETALSNNQVIRSSLDGYTGLRQVILSTQDQLEAANFKGLGRDALMMVLKAGPQTDYNTVVNLMDEMLISQVNRHAIVKITPEELEYIRR